MGASGGGRSLPDWVWPGLAFLSIVALMGYLYWATREVEVPMMEGGSATGGTPRATPAEFAAAPGRWSGRLVRLDSVLVAGRLGRAAFTVELPGRPRYPVVMERWLIEQGVQVTMQDRVTLVGSVYALNDSVLNVWTQRGIVDPARRADVAQDSTFFLADSLEILIPPFPGRTSGS